MKPLERIFFRVFMGALFITAASCILLIITGANWTRVLSFAAILFALMSAFICVVSSLWYEVQEIRKKNHYEQD